MITRPNDNKSRQFRIALGHSSVTVSGSSREEALANARMRLCREMPRLWDVIQTLDPRRFQVRMLGSED